MLILLHAMVTGGDAIDDAGVLRTGRTQEVLGQRVMAPSTLGTFLRSVTFGHPQHPARPTPLPWPRRSMSGQLPIGPETIIHMLIRYPSPSHTRCATGHHPQPAASNRRRSAAALTRTLAHSAADSG